MPRYVGKAIDPEKRFQFHLTEKTNFRKNHWIRSLQREGKLPVLEILLEVPEASWEEYEMDVIEALRNCGYDLTNTTDGGDGIRMTPEIEQKRRKSLSRVLKGKSRGPMSEETRAKLSAAYTPERREQQSRSMTGRTHTEEACAKISAVHKGKTLSAETRAKISAARLGKPLSPENAAKARVASVGRKLSEKHKAALVASRVGYKCSKETRAKMSASRIALYQKRRADVN